MNFNIKNRWLLLAGLLLCLCCQKKSETAVLKPVSLFEADSILQLTLSLDLKTVPADRGEDRKFHPARLFYTDATGKTVSLGVEVKTRGKLRRDIDICEFPPLSLKFDTAQVKNTIFQGQKKLKLVTHCQPNDPVFQQYVVEEYLVYRMYNLLTDYSFRVRLAQIRYAGSQGDTVKSYAFFIEEDDDMAKRKGGKILKTKGVGQDSTNHVRMSEVAVFQYMIGNVDWSVTNLHNIKLIGLPGAEPVVVPYDFDCTGLVDPPYAVPDTELYIKSVKERLYRGYCRSMDEFEWVFDTFRQKKEAFYALHRDCPALSAEKVKENKLFLDEFYRIIGDSVQIRKEFLEKCREKELGIKFLIVNNLFLFIKR